MNFHISKNLKGKIKAFDSQNSAFQIFKIGAYSVNSYFKSLKVLNLMLRAPSSHLHLLEFCVLSFLYETFPDEWATSKSRSLFQKILECLKCLNFTKKVIQRASNPNFLQSTPTIVVPLITEGESSKKDIILSQTRRRKLENFPVVGANHGCASSSITPIISGGSEGVQNL